MRRWNISHTTGEHEYLRTDDVIDILLKNRGIKTTSDAELFLAPVHPIECSPRDVGIDAQKLTSAIRRIKKALKNKESIVVHADYDADGITAGAILWETIYDLGGRVMPYVPKREEESRGLPKEGVDNVRELYDPGLIITVDHGITSHVGVSYALSLGIDMIVTDHHVKPKKLPDCPIVHTTQLAGCGVSWFLAKELLRSIPGIERSKIDRIKERLSLTAIGTIADLVPLIGPNRSIAKYGMEEIKKTKRVGLRALMDDASVSPDNLSTYTVSHVLAPRINAMGRLEHALDALRLLCTKKQDKAILLARTLGLTNKRRQDMTTESVMHAVNAVKVDTKGKSVEQLVFVSDPSYNPGIVGLIAGRLVEQFYRPSIAVSLDGDVYKGSARSIDGFDIIRAIRECSDVLVDAGGHPLAAGFTVEKQHLKEFEKRLRAYTEANLTEDLLKKVLQVDLELPIHTVTTTLWKKIQAFEPFGFGNPEPVFVARNLTVEHSRVVGKDRRHLKLVLKEITKQARESMVIMDAIAFGFGELSSLLSDNQVLDIAYCIDMNEWNGRRNLQLNIRDIHIQKTS